MRQLLTRYLILSAAKMMPDIQLNNSSRKLVMTYLYKKWRTGFQASSGNFQSPNFCEKEMSLSGICVGFLHLFPIWDKSCFRGKGEEQKQKPRDHRAWPRQEWQSSRKQQILGSFLNYRKGPTWPRHRLGCARHTFYLSVPCLAQGK